MQTQGQSWVTRGGRACAGAAALRAAHPIPPLLTHTHPATAAPTSIRSMSHRSRSWDVPGGEQRKTSTKVKM